MEVTLAQPRGFCAGVVRAIEIVERALELYGPPVYVLHEIVHNHRVLEELGAQGAVFVEDLDEVPSGSLLIFSAHGVSSAMVTNAEARGLKVIDATCPLVTKVHREVAHHARVGTEVVLIGHAGHPEVNGTFGRYDPTGGGAIYLVQTVEDVAKLEVQDPGALAYVTQTTLSLDDTEQIIAALRNRFPAITGPRKDDICYATQNRQNAVKALAGGVEVLVVVGARNSSNSNRLREVAEHMGLVAYLVQSAHDLDPAWFGPETRVGVTAGASAPEVLVAEVLARLQEFGAREVRHMDAAPEAVTFSLPPALAAASPRA
jgi:4-hydroxy-3-methylbut-2-en-1-yl diphosphate reductase